MWKEKRLDATEQDDREQIVEPFVSAVCFTLREWVGSEAFVRAVSQGAAAPAGADLVAVLPLRSALEGALVLLFPPATAAALADRVLAEVPEERDEALVRDCLGELANVIAGQAKALLAETPYRFTFATPTVTSGSGPGIRPERHTVWQVSFSSDLGDFALQLWLNR
jgi:chemotaxis protein CheX